MKLTITAKNLTLNSDVEKYAQRRLSRLDRRLRHSVPARLVIRREDTRRRDERFVAEVTADLKGAILRGEERGASLEAASDKVTDVLAGKSGAIRPGASAVGRVSANSKIGLPGCSMRLSQKKSRRKCYPTGVWSVRRGTR